MNDFEDFIRKSIQADNPAIRPDPAIEDRLSYTMNLKSANINIRKNSIADIFKIRH